MYPAVAASIIVSQLRGASRLPGSAIWGSMATQRKPLELCRRYLLRWHCRYHTRLSGRKYINKYNIYIYNRLRIYIYMLHTCDIYTTQYSVFFNANKSKCICCHPIGVSKRALRTFWYPSFFLGLHPIDCAKTWPHLGHIISHNYGYSDDLCAKKQLVSSGKWIKYYVLFCNVNCLTKTRLVKSYCASFYGAETW